MRFGLAWGLSRHVSSHEKLVSGSKETHLDSKVIFDVGSTVMFAPFTITFTTTGGLYVGVAVGIELGASEGNGVGGSVEMHVHELPRTQHASSSAWPNLPHMSLWQSEL